MSEFGSGTIRRVSPDPDQDAAAVRAALWRIDHAGAEPGDIRWALEALGLVEPAVVEPEPRPRVAPEQHPETKQFLKRLDGKSA